LDFVSQEIQVLIDRMSLGTSFMTSRDLPAAPHPFSSLHLIPGLLPSNRRDEIVDASSTMRRKSIYVPSSVD
jgi:hypothetical protein